MELYLYGPIFSFVADEVTLPALEEANKTLSKGEEVTLRINSPGGEVAAGWGIAAKMREMDNTIVAKVDGVAASMGAVISMFADRVEALDVSQFMIHRAAGPNDTEEERNLLNRVNEGLKQKVAAKIDKDRFREVSGINFEDIFDTKKERYNVWLTAKQAKYIGLVDEVMSLNTSATQEALKATQIAALNDHSGATITGGNNTKSNPENEVTMNTLSELQANYPQLFEQARQQGVSDERERVSSLLTYVDADQQDVVSRIKNGEELKPSVREDYMRKLQAANFQQALNNDTPGDAQTPAGGDNDPQQSQEQEEIKAVWEEAVKPELNSNNQNG